jgi:hypothetical protein
MAPCRISACIMAFKMHGSIGLSPTTKRQFCNLFLCRISRARASRSWSKKSSPDICPLHAFGGHALILAPIRRRWRLILGFNRKPTISGRYLVNSCDYGPQLPSRSGPPKSSIRHGGPPRSPYSSRSAYRKVTKARGRSVISRHSFSSRSGRRCRTRMDGGEFE